MPDRQAIKDGFIAIWNDMLPAGVLSVAEKAIPTAPTIATPTTVDESIIAQGVLSKYLLDVFKEYEGFTPIDLILHIGQRNNVNKAMLLSALEFTNKAEPSYSVMSPLPSGQAAYLPETAISFSIKIMSSIQDAFTISDISCILTALYGGGNVNIALAVDENDPERFAGTFQINTPGQWTVTFSVSFDDEPFTKEVLFDVQL